MGSPYLLQVVFKINTMKKLISSFIIISLMMSSCDKIDTPLQKAPGITGCIDTVTQIVKSNTGKSNYRKVLLEDYTGHTCPNCPRAGETAENLIATYGSSIVVIANHVSNTFARPKTDTTFKEDFRNEASTAWDNLLGMSNAGLPKGGVNRKTPYAQNHSAWPGLVSPALNQAQSAQIDLITYYDTKTKYLSVKTKTTFKTTWPNNTNIQVILIQDSIISDQYDSKPPAGATMDPNEPIRRLNYRFDHIVIGSVNGTWGELAKAAPITASDTVSKKYNCFLVEKCFFKKEPYPSVCLNDNHISVVVFIYDTSTYEVLQVEKVKIR